MELLPFIASILFGPALFLAGLRLWLGAKAARATWRHGLRWAYLLTLPLLTGGLIWWVEIDHALDHDEGPLVTLAISLLILLALSGAITGLLARTRWIKATS